MMYVLDDNQVPIDSCENGKEYYLMTKNPVACPISLNKSDKKASGDYFEFEVPDEIENLSFPVDEKNMYEILDSYTYQQENSIFARLVSNSEAPHIVFDLDDNGGRHKLDLKIRGTQNNPKYWLTLPAEYWKHNETSPFYGFDIEENNEAVVEINFSKNNIRLYKPADYGDRVKELVSNNLTPLIKEPVLFTLPIAYLENNSVEVVPRVQNNRNLSDSSRMGYENFGKDTSDDNWDHKSASNSNSR